MAMFWVIQCMVQHKPQQIRHGDKEMPQQPRCSSAKLNTLNPPKWHFVSTCKSYTPWQAIGRGKSLEFDPLYYFKALERCSWRPLTRDRVNLCSKFSGENVQFHPQSCSWGDIIIWITLVLGGLVTISPTSTTIPSIRTSWYWCKPPLPHLRYPLCRIECCRLSFYLIL
jgi:hypothetical protein